MAESPEFHVRAAVIFASESPLAGLGVLARTGSENAPRITSYNVCYTKLLRFGRVDQLTRVFLHVFTIMAIIGCIYGLHVKETGQHVAAFLYVGGSLGVTLCGDYLTLFIFWEMMAFASTFLVWYRKKRRSIEAGFRYLLVHTAGGLVLLAGIFLRYQNVITSYSIHYTKLYDTASMTVNTS